MSALSESSADGEASVRVFSALSELARTATDVDVAVADMLRQLCLLAPQGVDVDSVGVMLTDADSLRFLHAEPPPMVAVERLQEHLQLGPCFECIHRQQPVVVDDVTASRRWVRLTARPAWADVGVGAGDAAARREASLGCPGPLPVMGSAAEQS